MSKLRSVNTHFWSDNYVIELDPTDKLLFLYLLTNDQTNMLGIYELHIRKISFDTGIDLERVRKGFEAFAKGNKASYVEGYVCLHNFTKHQSYNKNMKVSAIKSFNELPLTVRKQPLCKPILKGLKPFPEGSKPTAEIESEVEREYEKEIEDTYVEPDGSDEFPDVCEYLDEATELANHLLYRIIEWKPDHRYANRSPSINNWILDIERMIRLDGREPEAIKGVIDYTFKKNTRQAQFWAKNIWSGAKLRDKYDRLVSDYKDENKTQPNGQSKNRADQYFDTAEEVLSQFESEDSI